MSFQALRILPEGNLPSCSLSATSFMKGLTGFLRQILVSFDALTTQWRRRDSTASVPLGVLHCQVHLWIRAILLGFQSQLLPSEHRDKETLWAWSPGLGHRAGLLHFSEPVSPCGKCADRIFLWALRAQC